jgi:hypothetical protein
MAIPHRPTALSILRIELVVGQFVIAQKFIPHCPSRQMWGFFLFKLTTISNIDLNIEF